MSSRHDARVLALQMLYQADLHRQSESDGTLTEGQTTNLAEPVDESAREYAETLCQGALANLPKIDACLERAAENWRIARMSIIDRNILRLAVQELSSHPEVPIAVVMDEAIELAKHFGSDESAKFVNGVLNKASALISSVKT